MSHQIRRFGIGNRIKQHLPIKPVIQIPIILLMTLLNSIYVSAQSSTLDFEANDIKIVVTPDDYLITWQNADEYGTDFSIASTNDPGVYACSTFCPQAALDAGAAFYKQFTVDGHGTVTVYYDENGKIIGTGADRDGDGIGDSFDSDTDGDGVDDTYDTYPFDPNRTSSQIGEIPGGHQVSSTGAANYTIPIEVAPGTAGIQPKLNLTYNSQGGNGLLGVGWSISGLSQISRCPQTTVNDNAIRGVDFSSQDRFCLDGQRLLVVSGTYGSNSAYYRTEIDGFSRISHSGSMGSGPSKFKVETKAGEVLEYTGMAAPNRSEAMSWMLSRVTDVMGNYMKINYSDDPGNIGEYYPVEIKYTGHNNDENFENTITFHYATRPDPRQHYMSGSKRFLTKRLAKITSSLGSYVFNYAAHETAKSSRLTQILRCDPDNNCLAPTRFEWEESTYDAGWQANNGFQPPAGVLFKKTTNDLDQGIRLLDVNADGYIDILAGNYDETSTEASCVRWELVYNPDISEWEMVCVEWEGGSTTPVLFFRAYLGSASGFNSNLAFAPLDDYPITRFGKDYGIRFGDFTGDGYPDMLLGYEEVNGLLPIPGTQVLKSWRNNKTVSGGTVWVEQGNSPTVFADNNGSRIHGRLMEMNGDGMTDYVTSAGLSNGDTDGNSGIHLSSGSLTWQTPSEAYSLAGYEIEYLSVIYIRDESSVQKDYGYRFADLNADGYTDWFYSRVDLSSNYESKTTISHNFNASVNQSFILPNGFETGYANSTYAEPTHLQIVELNGDGLPDLIRPNKETSIALINTGRQFEITSAYDLPDLPTVTAKRTDVNNGIQVSYQHLPFIFIDLNGDGLDDAVYAAEGQTAKAYLNTGTGWSSNIVNFAPPAATTSSDNEDLGVRFADVNGDGMVDMIRSLSTSNTVYYNAWLNQSKAPLLKTITPGNGASTTFTYKPLTDNSVYTKGMNADTPVERDVQSPINVVSKVSTSNGIGGLLSSTYKYEELKVNTRGRGPLGFKKVIVTDEQSNITTTTEYRQDFPYIGLPWKVTEKQANNQTISSVENTYANITTAGAAKFPYVSVSKEKIYDFDSGVQLTEITTNTYYNGSENGGNYGNPTRFHVVTDDKQGSGQSFTTTTDHKYKPADTSRWILGRLKEAKATKTNAANETGVRKSTFGYSDTTGMLAWESIEPDSTDEGVRLSTIYLYDAYGNIRKKTLCESTASSCAHDTAGNRTVTTNYNAGDGRFIESVTNALGQTEYHSYDSKYGGMTSLTGPNELTTHWYYDSFGLQTKEVRADGTQTNFSYTRCGSCPGNAKYFIASQATGSAKTTKYFDSLNRTVRTTTQGFDGSTIYVDTQYDARGRVDKVSEPYYSGAAKIYWTQTSYDNLDRPITINTPGGDLDNNGNDQTLTQTIDYDKFKTTTTDAKGRSKIEIKNAIGQTVEITDVANTSQSVTTEYRYDGRGNLKETQIKNRPETLVEIAYDKRDRKVRLEDPSLGIWTYQYNAFGELTEQTDAKNQKTTITYDDLGRIDLRTDLAGTASAVNTDWVYGTSSANKNVGKLISESISGGASKTYIYDSLGRLKDTTQVIDGQSFVVTSAYHSSTGRLDTVTYPSANSNQARYAVQHIYNNYGYLSKVQSVESTPVVHWQATEMNARGQLETQKLANGIIEINHAYNLATGWLDGTVADSNTTGILQHKSYFYDKAGNLKSRTDNRLSHIKTETFSYDNHDRLTNSYIRNNNGGTIGVDKVITYDSNQLGNIASKTGIGSYTYGTYNAANCSGVSGVDTTPGPYSVTHISGSAPEAGAYCYDANGNLKQGGGRSIDYTSFNKPSVFTKGTTQTQFHYGPDRSRVIKIVKENGNETIRTQYVGLGTSGGALYQKETNTQSGQVKHMHNIYAAGKVVAMHLVETNGTTTNQSDEYYLYDHQGSLEVVTDASGNVTARQSHDAWGKRRNTNWTDHTSGTLDPINANRGYTGHETIEEMSLIHMNGRVYDPAIGRFLSADPMVQFIKSSQNFNRYSYVFNNPLKYTDPTGYLSNKLEAILEFAIGIYLVSLGNPAGFTLGTALIQRSFNLANGNNPNQGITLNYSMSFAYGKASAPKAYNLSSMQTGRSAKLKARHTTPILSKGLMSRLQEITERYISFETGKDLKPKVVKGDDKPEHPVETDSYKKTVEKEDNVADDAGTDTQIQAQDTSIGGYSPLIGTATYTTEEGSYVTLYANEYGGLFENDGTSYALNSDGSVHSLQSGAAEQVCPSCYVIGGGVLYRGYRIGAEISIGRNFRLAPFGNRTGNPFGRFPHYHRRGLDGLGNTRPGQGIGRHRPWETKSPDRSFWDRF